MKFGRFFRPAAFFSFLGMLFPLVLNSCSQISGAINEPVREYFERGSTVTQIVSHEILSVTTSAPAATAKDKNGHICVGSVSEIKVKLHVNNPMNYTFTEGSNLSYYLVDSTSATLTGADSISLSMTSSTEWELTYPASFLQDADPGKLGAAAPKLSKNISVRIDLSHPETGTAFPSYTVPLYCNSVPPLIGNAVTYTKTDTATGLKTYVVCFTIAPLNPTTQNDLKYLKIGSTTIQISVSSSIISSADTKLHSSNINAVTPPPGCTYQPNGQAFPIGVPNQSFYYETNDPVTTDKAYTISLIDEAGLTSSATTAANSYTIAATTLIDSTGNSHAGVLAPDTPTSADEIKLGQDEDSFYAKVKIKVPTSATGPVTKSVSGVTVDYTVTNTSDSSTVATGTTTSDYNLNLAPGTYTIVCIATKDGYTQSETTFSVKVIPTKVYVSASSGDDDTGNGTIDYPYKTISHADNKLPSASETPTGAVRTIYVLDDLGSEQPNTTTILNADCINCQNHTLTDVHLNISRNCVLKNATIAGTTGSKKITGSGTGTKVLENVILAKAGVTTDEIVTGPTKLINVKSTENNVINGNSITIAGKINGLTFTMLDNKTLAITSSLAGSSGNKIVLNGTDLGKPSAGHPRVFTTGYSTYNTANPASYFTSDSYGIIKATVTGGTEEAALAVSGGSISVYTPDGKLTLTPSSYSIPTAGGDITISATGTLESGTTVDDSDTTKFTDWDIKAYYEYDYRHASPTAAPTPAAVPAATSPLTLNFPAGYPAGNYVIVIFVTFNGTRYSSEIVVTKS
ncbi:MAG: hypothetical protein IKQ23_10110 [Treponema sp.]|nr:hypothetical protein [Treponema sp.]